MKLRKFSSHCTPIFVPPFLPDYDQDPLLQSLKNINDNQRIAEMLRASIKALESEVCVLDVNEGLSGFPVARFLNVQTQIPLPTCISAGP